MRSWNSVKITFFLRSALASEKLELQIVLFMEASRDYANTRRKGIFYHSAAAGSAREKVLCNIYVLRYLIYASVSLALLIGACNAFNLLTVPSFLDDLITLTRDRKRHCGFPRDSFASFFPSHS